jgi:hypothetical protein
VQSGEWEEYTMIRITLLAALALWAAVPGKEDA